VTASLCCRTGGEFQEAKKPPHEGRGQELQELLER